MTLREARVAFSSKLALLVQHINETPGYTCALGEVMRSDEQAATNALGEGGRARLANLLADYLEFQTLAVAVSNNGRGNGILLSVHRSGLGCDVMLYKDGVWCQDAADYQQFAAWWKQQHELARAGYDFRDPAHFSFEWGGRK